MTCEHFGEHATPSGICLGLTIRITDACCRVPQLDSTNLNFPHLQLLTSHQSLLISPFSNVKMHLTSFVLLPVVIHFVLAIPVPGPTSEYGIADNRHALIIYPCRFYITCLRLQVQNQSQGLTLTSWLHILISANKDSDLNPDGEYKDIIMHV